VVKNRAVANDILNIASRVNNAIRSDRPKRIAATTVLAKHKARIFERGEAESGGKIGTYSTKPISIARSQQARDTGQTYFKTGYAGYKTAVGKNPGFVILRNTDQMYADYGLVQSGSEIGFGFQNQHNTDKAGWMESKYDKSIFELSDSEFNLYVDVLLSEQTKAF
jgi:hypothetical protein